MNCFLTKPQIPETYPNRSTNQPIHQFHTKLISHTTTNIRLVTGTHQTQRAVRSKQASESPRSALTAYNKPWCPLRYQFPPEFFLPFGKSSLFCSNYFYPIASIQIEKSPLTDPVRSVFVAKKWIHVAVFVCGCIPAHWRLRAEGRFACDSRGYRETRTSLDGKTLCCCSGASLLPFLYKA